MPDKAWKKTERTHSFLFGAKGVRTGPTGLDLPDWVSNILAGESKHTSGNIPKWLNDDVLQSVENAERYEAINSLGYPLIPVVVYHVSGEKYETDDIVIIRAAEFLSLVLPAIEHFFEAGGYSGEGPK